MAETIANLYSETEIWKWLGEVPDPEIPVVSVIDLGIVRKVTVIGGGVIVDVSPTYSGCPATEFIEDSIKTKLQAEGLAAVTIRRVLSPPWTTDWITKAGRDKLLEYGIAPPASSASMRDLLGKAEVHCPRCGSNQTTAISEFGSTACKASYKCDECLEPFEYFKCI